MNSWCGCLRPPCGRHRGRRPLQDLQQRLLDALTGDVTGDRGVLALAGDLVDLVDVDDARLGLLDVVVSGLDQLEQDVLDVLTDIAGLGQRGGVGDRERDVEHPREGLGEVGLAAAGGTDQQDVGLGDVDRVGVLLGAGLTGLDALVVVVDRHGQRPLGGVLADDELLEEVEDLARLGQLVQAQLRCLGQLLLDDLVAQVDALVADVDTRTGNELLHLLLALAAERALQQVATVSDACHEAILPVGLPGAGSSPSRRASVWPVPSGAQGPGRPGSCPPPRGVLGPVRRSRRGPRAPCQSRDGTAGPLGAPPH